MYFTYLKWNQYTQHEYKNYNSVAMKWCKYSIQIRGILKIIAYNQ